MITDAIGMIIVILFVFLLGAAVAMIIITDREAREAYSKGYRQGIEDIRKDWSTQPRYMPPAVNVRPARIRHRRSRKTVTVTRQDPAQVSEAFVRRLRERGRATEILGRSDEDDEM